MQILIDVRLLGRGGVSGIEEYTRNLLGALLAADRKNDYRLFYGGWRKQPISFPPARVIDWPVPNKLLDFGARFLGLPALDRFIPAGRVFSPHFNILKTAAPRVITFHDLSFLHHPQFFSRKQRFWHWMQAVRRQAAEAARIIAVSEFTKSDLVNLLGVPTEKISVVYSGVSEEFKPNLRSSQDLKFTGNQFILYLGTLEPRKNVPAIIRAFNLLKSEPAFRDWRLVLAGRPGWLYRSIHKEAAASPHRGDILFRGSVQAEERALLYNSARVFVYPSFFEGFGLPPLEAQACGCPVVAADRTALPEVLGGSALLVDPWKAGDLTAAIRLAALDSPARDRLIAAGRKNAARFHWPKTARETLQVIQNAG